MKVRELIVLSEAKAPPAAMGRLSPSTYGRFSAAVREVVDLAEQMNKDVESILDEWVSRSSGQTYAKMLGSVLDEQSHKLKKASDAVMSASKKAKKKMGNR